MTAFSNPAAAGAGPAPPVSPWSGPLEARLSALYALAQDSPYVFASPLGPFDLGGVPAYVPRLVFFGPQASDDSWRLAFLAGFDHRDLRASRALLALVAGLADNVEAGHGLNLSFFPLVDVAGSRGAGGRPASAIPWGRAATPEIRLLEQDARSRGYHGFIRVETAPAADDLVSIRIRQPLTRPLSPDLELFTSDEAESFPVRFEAVAAAAPLAGGPLAMTADLPVAPFELILSIPGAWPEHDYQRAVVVLLKLLSAALPGLPGARPASLSPTGGLGNRFPQDAGHEIIAPII